MLRLSTILHFELNLDWTRVRSKNLGKLLKFGLGCHGFLDGNHKNATLLAANLPGAGVIVGDCTDPGTLDSVLASLPDSAALFVDPARRTGRRTADGSRAQSERDPERWSPPLSFVIGLADTTAFELGTAGTNVKAKCTTVLATIEENLKGEFMNGVHCLCSAEFFAALTGHAKVEKAFENWQNGAILINDVRRGFTYGGITFEEYRGQATDTSGTARRFIAAGEAHAFPLGTIDTFGTYFAPADFNETVNTVGQPLYAKQEPRKFDRGTDLHTQANPLPLCHRPQLLVKLEIA